MNMGEKKLIYLYFFIDPFQMLKLRRWMTEILLDVTTEMMEEVASEVLNRARMKGTPLTGVSCVGRVVSTVALHWQSLTLSSRFGIP